MKKVLTFLLLVFPFWLQAQHFQGKVADQNGKLLAYVSIGVVGKDIGTVSDKHGNFSLTLPDSLNKEILQFSAIGYSTVQLRVLDYKQNIASKATVTLKDNPVNLSEIVVKPKEYKTRVVGNETTSKTMIAGFTSNTLGSEIGTILKINKPSFVDKITFNIASNQYDTLFLRVNIYKMGKKGPEENLLRKPIYLNVAKKDVGESITLDIKEYNIYLDSDALLSLELVRDLGTKGLWFSGGMLNSDSFYRKASQGDWGKVPLLGLGFNATISQEK